MQRPPYSVGLFSFQEIKAITDYMINTYYRHYKLYQYVYTKCYTLDFSESGPLVETIPELVPLAAALSSRKWQEYQVRGMLEFPKGGVKVWGSSLCVILLPGSFDRLDWSVNSSNPLVIISESEPLVETIPEIVPLAAALSARKQQEYQVRVRMCS